MTKTTFKIALLSITLTISSFALAVDCDALHKTAEEEGGYYRPAISEQVIKKGRLYLHSAPHATCKTDVFIIKNDSVVAYQNHNGYDYIMYMNPKTGEDFFGWVSEKALKYTGTVGLASQE